MATFNKFNQFTDDLIAGVHNFDSHTFKVYLSNTAPDAAADAVKADLAEVSAGGGYSAGGATVAITTSTSGGTAKVVGVDVTFTSSGAFPTFRYVVFYNDTPTSPADPLIGWYDYGSAVSLANGETFTVDFDGTNGILTVA